MEEETNYSQSDVIDALGNQLKWRITKQYSFRETSQINLQELRDIKKEVTDWTCTCNDSIRGNIHCGLCDSAVIGVVNKGRSSSYKLNGILRSMLCNMIVTGSTIALNYINTHFNPADYPSRGAPLPTEMTGSAAVWGSNRAGLEVFAGSCGISRAHSNLGLRVDPPVEIAYGLDAFDASIERQLVENRIAWLWLAPPCSSFTPLTNFDIGGPLRPAGCPEGCEDNARVAEGNRIWRRAIALAELAYTCGVPVTMEHPKLSRAWGMKETQHSRQLPGMKYVHFDHCMYTGPIRTGLPNQKATRLLTSAPWAESVCVRCDHSHKHGEPLCGQRAKQAASYPGGFCQAWAGAFQAWQAAGGW